jgi:uncharacterized protein (TIGR02996 family)
VGETEVGMTDPALLAAGFEPFMRAIVDQPDDDAIRLVAADWLDEHGEPERAEFIRVQCELARLPELAEPKMPRMSYNATVWNNFQREQSVWLHESGRRIALRRRERALLDANFLTWLSQLLEPIVGTEARFYGGPNDDGECQAAHPLGGCRFVRGFVSQIETPFADWQTHAAALLAACPIRRVNKPRECPECGDDGRAREVRRVTPERPVCVCHGTGQVDDWKGDGLVRLTTWPDADLGTVQPDQVGIVESLLAAHCTRLFAAEWPGVKFEFPGENREQAEGRHAAAFAL